MKKILISLVCVLLLCVSIGTAQAADTYVVHQPGTLPCTTASPDDNAHYQNSIQGAADEILHVEIYGHCDPNCLGGENPGCFADNDGDDKMDVKIGETIIVCPSEIPYIENVDVSNTVNCNPTPKLTIRSYTNNPEDVIVQAADNENNVLLVQGRGNNGITISGLTLQGADSDIDNCTDKMLDDPDIPCAGIRFFGLETGYIKNNIIKGNNHGIIIKDTSSKWVFRVHIEDNEILENNVGVHFRYGNMNYLWNNYIHDNTTAYGPEGIGVKLIDTWNNSIVGNDIEDNDIGITHGDNYYHSYNNTIYHNNIRNNNLLAYQVSDIRPESTNWHEPTLLRGNFWSDNPDGSIFPFPDVDYDDYPRSSPYVYDNDLDDDGIENEKDNCPDVPNSDQADIDTNGMGDECECPDEYEYNNTHYDDYSDRDISKLGKLWPSFQEAIDTKPMYLLSRSKVFEENITIDQSPPYEEPGYGKITLHAGFDCNYTINNGTTKLKGDMDIIRGTLKLRTGVLKIE